MRMREYLISADLLVGLIAAVMVALVLPDSVKATFARDLYSTAIAVLSIIFSLYFAAFAIIMTSNDNDFIRFMEEGHHFTALISHYRFTLGSLFLALICAIIFYIGTSYSLSIYDEPVESKWFLVGSGLLTTYSLVATALSGQDAIRFAEYRAKFICLGRKSDG